MAEEIDLEKQKQQEEIELQKAHELRQKELEQRLSSLLKDLISQMDSLSVLMKKENNFIKRGLVDEALESIEKKKELIFDFESTERELISCLSEGVEKKPEKLVEKFADKYAVLKELTRDNEILLKSSVIATEEILKLYKEKQKEGILRDSNYDEKGRAKALLEIEKAEMTAKGKR